MQPFYKKVLLLSLFAVAAMFIFHTRCVYAVSKSSQKTKISELHATGEVSAGMKGVKIVSRGYKSPIGSVNANSVIIYAKRFLGAEYKYGASGPNRFDCSGFTMYVMSKFGIDLPHSAAGQSRYGAIIPRDKLMPGDLIYFAISREKGISHVGIYIGDGDFIHASSGGVAVNNITEVYYRSRYVMAARVIG